jgi:formate dehydrogenase
VAIDFVQRESHRHAHWLLPAVHWLERDDLLAFTSNMHDEPYVQYGVKAVEPPPGARQEWRIFVDLAIAMNKPLFRAKGLNRFAPAASTGYPFQLANRRNRHSMNSWLNELPGLHPSGKRNEVVIHPADASALGINEGDRVRVFSPSPRSNWQRR